MLSRSLIALALLALPASAGAQVSARIGLLSCDVSAGVGLIVFQKQTMTCTFRPDGGGAPDRYTGSIDQYGLEIGATERSHLVWAVAAASQGLSQGALAGTYAGVSADAAAGIGAGASALIGGTGRAFSLQPIAVEGETGINLAAGVRTVTLRPAN
ncbi:DUF992 domain-containing protein [Microvirga pudoricolor]|uniref:DUF992 domain-containing protein n=1 Tax=Microvirga pudoricolor TaxID=2778729 RepID=UPI00194F0BCB|nr:DUF992 domain-containing protein [Microvirga pudoricolor]MBM6595215.1 DUF992 domain-containing protein [Microvirga pudoricolor]